jgi:hypothetical protein
MFYNLCMTRTSFCIAKSMCGVVGRALTPPFPGGHGGEWIPPIQGVHRGSGDPLCGGSGVTPPKTNWHILHLFLMVF